jgi:hypothetical protein
MKDENWTVDSTDLSSRFDASARPVITVDVEKYQALLDGSDLSPEQKEEFLQALWLIVVTFVELGFGVHPLQVVCGQSEMPGTRRLKDAFNQVDSKKSDNIKPPRESGPPGGLEAE